MTILATMKLCFLPVLLAVPTLLVAQSSPPPTLLPPRLDVEITVDGVLDESAWQQAARAAGFFQFRPVDSRPAEDSTVVLVWYSPTAIHFGILAYDRDPGSIRATLSDRDNIGSDDQVTIFLDTFNDRRRAYFFGVNPFGVQDDGVRSEGGFSTGGQSGSTDRNPDFQWESSGRLTPTGWVAEIRIPFKSLRWSSGTNLSWGFNVQRVTRRTGYEDTWTDVRRANASFLAQAGMITGIRDIERGVVVEMQPTLTAEVPGRRVAGGAFERDDPRIEVGANFRLGFTQFTLDGTINPDFSQVEADAGLVTINERFALFFPERRPFFLEGIELFATPSNLVYTRTVANPLGGAKLTGKLGQWTIAHLTAIDEFGQSRDGGVTPDTRALVNVTRLRRDVGANSVAGFTMTHRDEDGDFNRVLSADTRLVFGELYYLQAQLGLSVTGDGRDDDWRAAPLWNVEVDRTGRAFGFNYQLSAVEADFETWSGFVNRTDIASGRAFNRYSIYGARGAFLEQASIVASISRVWEYERVLGSHALEGRNNADLSLRMRGGWNLGVEATNNFVRFERADYAGYTVASSGGPIAFMPASGVFDAWTGSAKLSTPTWQAWQGSFEFEQGRTAIFPEASEGNARAVSGSISLRPSSAVRLSGTLRVQQLDRLDGSEFARTVLPRVKLEVQPNRALFFRLVAEYRSQRQSSLRDPVSGLPLLVAGSPRGADRADRLRMDWLASYEPTPGTIAFIGYGSTLDGDRALTLRSLERVADGIFVKVAYLFRK